MANHTPAFPLDVRGKEFSPPGMDLRDYFAAHAIQGILANHKNRDTNGEMALWAYGISDAMMVERMVDHSHERMVDDSHD